MATVTIKSAEDAAKVQPGDQIIFELPGTEKLIEDTTMEVIEEIAKLEDEIMVSINERLEKEANQPEVRTVIKQITRS